ncbi:MAG: hypothetical protein Q9184_003563 [Pyrenodesmia sp. 2 TL-2023]
MAGRCRSLATAVIGVLFGSIVQHAGFDLDPVVFAPMEDVVAEIIMSASSSVDTPTPSLPMIGQGPTAVQLFPSWRFFNDIDTSLILLIFLVLCQLFAIIFDYLVGHRARAPAAVIKSKPTVTVNAIARLLRSLSNLAVGHVRFWLAMERFSTKHQAAVSRNQQQHHKIIEKLHHGYQRLIHHVEATSTEMMNDMWQRMQDKDARITELVHSGSVQSTEMVLLKVELQAAHQDKRIIQDKLSICEQRLGHAENERSMENNVNATIRDQLSNQTNQNKKLNDVLSAVTQEKSKTLEELRQKIKNLEATCKGHTSEKSRLNIQLQAEGQAKDRLQNRIKDMDEREAQLRDERNTLQNTNSSLQSEIEEIIAQKAILESKRAQLTEENATLKLHEYQHVKTIQKLGNGKADLAQRVQCVESPEQGEATPQSFPANKNQEKDEAKQTVQPASGAETQHGSTNGNVFFSGVNAGSSSHGDNPEPSSVVSPSTDNNAMSDRGQPIGSGSQNAGTFTFTQDVSSTYGGSRNSNRPPSPTTNREADRNPDAGGLRLSPSANRKAKPLYVPVHKRQVSDTSSTPKSESSIPPSGPPANGHNLDSCSTGGSDAAAATGSSGTTNAGANTGSYQQRQNRRTNKYRNNKKKAARDSLTGDNTGAGLNNYTGGKGHQVEASSKILRSLTEASQSRNKFLTAFSHADALVGYGSWFETQRRLM